MVQSVLWSIKIKNIYLGTLEKSMPNTLHGKKNWKCKEAGFEYSEMSIDETEENLQDSTSQWMK